jgi:hypothetical protein
MKACLLLSAVLAVLAGCTGPAGATDPAADSSSQARRLYVAKCARCHKLYDPAGYVDAEWRDWMVKMSRKAKLKPDQEALLSRYLETLRKGRDQRD